MAQRKTTIPKFVYDYFGLAGPPDMVLCNPNKDKLYSLGGISERELIARFNGLWELSFKAHRTVNKTIMPYYAYLQQRRLVYVEQIGYFLITDVSEQSDGIIRYKEVKCQSLEAEFQTRRMVVYVSGSSLTGDPESVTLSELMEGTENDSGIIETYIPDWRIGTGGIPDSLSNKQRGFNISDKTVYDFLMNNVEESYGCTIRFNTVTNTIYFEDTEENYDHSGIYMSLDNVIENITKDEISDELATCLHVLGGGGLDISIVNPLGTNYIYNFDYFKNTKWMSTELIAKLDQWEDLYYSYIDAYAQLVSDMVEYSQYAEEDETALIIAKTQLAAKETELSAAIYAGRNTASLLSEIAALKNTINALLYSINYNWSHVEASSYAKQAINRDLSFTDYDPIFGGIFTEELYLELLPFIIQSSYVNDSIILTDNMTITDQYNQAEQLFEKAIEVLNKTSSPKYTFAIDAINFMAIPEFASFHSQLKMGIDVKIAFDYTEVDAYLLEMEVNFDDLNDFKVTFGNRQRPENPNTKFTDIMNNAITAGETTKINSLNWNNWSNNYKDTVTSFVSSELNAQTNPIISSSSMNVTINSAGLIARNNLSGNYGDYDNRQLWVIKDKIFKTMDGWQTYSELLSTTLTSTLATGINTVDNFLVPELESEEYGFLLHNTVGTLLPTRISSGSTIDVNLRGVSASMNVTTGDISVTGSAQFGGIYSSEDITVAGFIWAGEYITAVEQITAGTSINATTDVTAWGGNIVSMTGDIRAMDGGVYVGSGESALSVDSADVWARNDVRAGGGLSIGDVTYNPGAGILAGRDDGRFGGGLSVGGSTINPDTGDIITTGSTTTHGITSVGNIETTTSIRAVGGIYVGSWGTPTTDDIIADGSIEAGTTITAGTSFIAVGDIRVNEGGAIGDMYYNPSAGILAVRDDVRVGGGLYVGGSTVGAATGEITTTGDINSGATFLGSAGTNLLPTFSFTGDPNTGVHNLTADRLAFATGGTNRVIIDSSGLLIGTTTANALIDSTGIMLETGAGTANNNAFCIKANTIAHGGLSGAINGDAYFTISEITAAQGGVVLDGTTMTQTIGAVVRGLTSATMDTTHTVDGRANVEVHGYRISGNNAADATADSNVFAVRTRRSSTVVTVAIVDEDGDLHLDAGGGTGGTIHGFAFDEFDDAQLIRALDMNRPSQGLIKDKFDDWVKYNKEDLEKLDIASFDENGGVFVNIKALSFLHNGAIWQLYKKLEKMEQALLKAGIQPELLTEET